LAGCSKQEPAPPPMAVPAPSTQSAETSAPAATREPASDPGSAEAPGSGGLSLVERIKTPLERKEVGNGDCTKNGCPARTANPANQPASYGWPQLTVDTLLRELASNRGIPECVGISEDDVKRARERSRLAAIWFTRIDDEHDPDRPPHEFLAQTGLSAEDYRAIVYWKRLEDLVDDHIPSRNADAVIAQARQTGRNQIDVLLQRVGMSERDLSPYLRTVIWNEAKQGFAAKAALASPVESGGDMRGKLLRLFMTKSCHDEIADRMISLKVIANQARWPIAAPLTDEDYSNVIAALVAYQHNVGHVYGTVKRETGDPQLLPTRSKTFAVGLYCFGYVREFYTFWSGQPLQSCPA